jgi:hypothetical protein
VAFARCKVPEGHFELAAFRWFEVMHSACKAVGGKPFGKRVRLKERTIDLLGARWQNAVQAYGARHGRNPFELME